MADTWYGPDSGLVGQHVTTWGGSLPNVPGNIRFVKTGRIVTLVLPATGGISTSTGTIDANTKLPSFLWPEFTVQCSVQAVVNGVTVIGDMEILSGDGSIIFFADLNSGTFTNAQSNGFNAQSIASYISAS